MADINIPKGVSQETLDKALAAFEKAKSQRAKQAAKRKNDPEFKEKQKAQSLKNRISRELLVAKAKKAGIEVTPQEVQAEIKKRAGK